MKMDRKVRGEGVSEQIENQCEYKLGADEGQHPAKRDNKANLSCSLAFRCNHCHRYTPPLTSLESLGKGATSFGSTFSCAFLELAG